MKVSVEERQRNQDLYAGFAELELLTQNTPGRFPIKLPKKIITVLTSAALNEKSNAHNATLQREIDTENPDKEQIQRIIATLRTILLPGKISHPMIEDMDSFISDSLNFDVISYYKLHNGFIGQTDAFGNTPLHSIVRILPKETLPSVFSTILELSLNYELINDQNTDKQTVLHLLVIRACIENDSKVTECLNNFIYIIPGHVRNKLKFDLTDIAGNTPIKCATNAEIMGILKMAERRKYSRERSKSAILSKTPLSYTPSSPNQEKIEEMLINDPKLKKRDMAKQIANLGSNLSEIPEGSSSEEELLNSSV